MSTTYANQEFRIAGKPLKCAHCGGSHFDSRLFYMEPNLWFFRDWPSQQIPVNTFGCTQCGRLEQFLGGKIELAEAPETIAGRVDAGRVCPECGLAVDKALKTCPGCDEKLV